MKWYYKFLIDNNTCLALNDAISSTYLFKKELNKYKKKFPNLKLYINFYEDRGKILQDYKEKVTGIYCLINKINGHDYIGSSINISNRVRSYLNNRYLSLKANNNKPISPALLKYGQQNFAFIILEFLPISYTHLKQINKDKNFLLDRETFWIVSFLPYYNVLKYGTSSKGYKHTVKTRNLLSNMAKNRKLSNKTKALISVSMLGNKNSFFGKHHRTVSILKIINKKIIWVSIFIW